MSKKRPTYAEWLGDRTDSGSGRALSDAEQAMFDRWYRNDASTARQLARRIVGDEAADDAVHGAITRMMRAIVTGRIPSPTQDEAFRRGMLLLVQYLATNLVAGKRYTPPAHSHWGQVQAPVSLRKVPERLLTRNFESYTEEPAEAADAGAAYPLLPSSAYRGPWGPQPDPLVMAQELEFILAQATFELTAMQECVIAVWLEDPSRDSTSGALGISPKTYDTHLARAKPKLRATLVAVPWMVPDVPGHPEGGWHLSDWVEVFKDMELDRLERKRAARIRIEKQSAVMEEPKAA